MPRGLRSGSVRRARAGGSSSKMSGSASSRSPRSRCTSRSARVRSARSSRVRGRDRRRRQPPTVDVDRDSGVRGRLAVPAAARPRTDRTKRRHRRRRPRSSSGGPVPSGGLGLDVDLFRGAEPGEIVRSEAHRASVAHPHSSVARRASGPRRRRTRPSIDMRDATVLQCGARPTGRARGRQSGPRPAIGRLDRPAPIRRRPANPATLGDPSS